MAESPETDWQDQVVHTSGQPSRGTSSPTASSYADAVREAFADRWPAGSPWSGGQRRFWLFQANPQQWNLLEHLPVMLPGMSRTGPSPASPGHGTLVTGAVLWQGGQDAEGDALGRLAGTPDVPPTPGFRPESAGEQEYRVDLLVERHVLPPITRDQARQHPVLAPLDVLHRPLADPTRLWHSINGGPSASWRLSNRRRWLRCAGRHWCTGPQRLLAESVDFDAEERSYKLEIRDRLLAARDAITAGAADWPRLLRWCSTRRTT